MSKKFAEVQQDDFMKFGAERPSYLDIEDALMAMGGHGVGGNNFKNEMVKLAGWADNLTAQLFPSTPKYPERRLQTQAIFMLSMRRTP